MKKLFYFLFLGIAFLACSQEKKVETNKQQISYDINKYIFPEAKDITETNYVEKLNSQIKHYKEEPIYYFRIYKNNCLIELDINDVRDYKDFELSNVITPTKIGHILKSGKQEINVKMYPIGNLHNEDLGLENQTPETKLSEKSKVEIEVIMIDNKSNKQFSDEKSIIKKVSPKEVVGKEYFEFSFTFDAEVPYEFDGWTNGQDLRKLDQELVRKKSLEYYQMVGNIFLEKDLNSWLKINYPIESRIKGMFYADKRKVDMSIADFNKKVLQRDYEIQSIKNFNLKIMGHGKLLRLVTNNQHPKLRGGGALLLNYGNGGVYQPGITLYLPEGRDLATQGFMMWK